MLLSELLLNSSSFTEMLKQYSINPSDFTIKDEEWIVAQKDYGTAETFKETIVIQGKKDDADFNLIGTVYCNFLKNVAVFEPDAVIA